ncbi:3-keto-disaccharide hydrolase [Maribacter aestuarii]|uniref:3-keto-disaccharide hydrolase n=1 Tax=Maribacter aestuarii TaxID=1130723 RepID=UPI00248C6378|nr:DUF1080 domain-containing protein [Maribacter aestuarii]
MKKEMYYVATFIILIFVSVSNAQSVSLFNGENLDGWTIYGTEKWYVDDGVLVCESGPDAQYGYLATNEAYKNFILELEFKQEADGNSGVFIRSTVEGTTVNGWQIEVAPPGYHTGGVYESYGRKWLIKPDEEKEGVLKMGEWNTMKIKVDRDKIISWLNGTEMISLTDSIIGKGEGSILLQIHDGGGIKVKWRNIQLTELD